MDQGRGLWDLLFGVSDPDAATSAAALDSTSAIIKTEDSSELSMDLSEELLALLADPLNQNQSDNMGTFLTSKDSSSSSASLDLMDIIPNIDLSNCTGLDLEVLGELSAYLQMPDFVSSSSISSSRSDDGLSCTESSSDNLSVQGSPKSTHSSASSDSGIASGKHKEELVLTREELILLKKEGLALPKCHPLTKQEERTLKKIRRKIRNKKSAQESRRKKKVYMDTLEDQVKDVAMQNKTLQKRVKELEKENVSLQQQLKTLQNIFGRATRNTKATGTCLMALVLSVALIVSPYTQNNANDADKDLVLVGDYQVENVAPVRSRIMYNLDGPPEPRPFGLPLAKDGFRMSHEDGSHLGMSVLKTNSNVVGSDGVEGTVMRGDAGQGKENISITLSQNRPVSASY